MPSAPGSPHIGSASLGIIWAEADGGAIGREGKMPWHLPEDLAHFQRTTEGSPVIMGRRTWESLPPAFRPLPKRTNIVVTRSRDFGAEGATVVASLDAAMAEAERVVLTAADTEHASRRRIWVMGGGELYRQAMPLATELVVTRIELAVPDADTFAPPIGPEWRCADPGEQRRSKTGLGYRIERWMRT